MIVDNIADIVLLIIVLVSVGLSIKRGFAKEALMLASLLASIYVAYLYGNEVGSYCTFLTAAILRQGFGYFLAFSVTSLLAAAIRGPILRALSLDNVNVVDRLAGAIFGLARGGVAVALLIAALNNTPIVQQPWWEDSFFIPHIENTSQKAIAKIPEKWKHDAMALVEKFETEYA
jgi:membrane protein required for colicin V production